LTVARGRDKTAIEKAKKRSRYFGGTPKQNDIGKSGRSRRYLREGC
jgi:hypothetical protein